MQQFYYRHRVRRTLSRFVGEHPPEGRKQISIGDQDRLRGRIERSQV
jgi:hypothetical protein